MGNKVDILGTVLCVALGIILISGVILFAQKILDILSNVLQ